MPDIPSLRRDEVKKKKERKKEFLREHPTFEKTG
jgi:hypothetical protein